MRRNIEILEVGQADPPSALDAPEDAATRTNEVSTLIHEGPPKGRSVEWGNFAGETADDWPTFG
jgi:hypothetical protein